MPSISITLTDPEYAALTKTQELMAIAGGPATTPEEYLQLIVESLCANYAQQYPADTPSAAEVAILKDAMEREKAKAAELAEKEAAAQAALLAEKEKVAALEAEKTSQTDPLAEVINNL